MVRVSVSTMARLGLVRKGRTLLKLKSKTSKILPCSDLSFGVVIVGKQRVFKSTASTRVAATLKSNTS